MGSHQGSYFQQNRCQDLLSYWSICLTVLHMIELSQMNERLHDIMYTQMGCF